ncbi:MAG: protein kinase [Deltaproteobacteria bacterium]|nr:protein kinase [Deltaproteobacteria bacterium]
MVYACYDRATATKVALKRVDRPGRASPTGASGETFWFHQEARALASLDHPAIVRGRDFGVLDDGSPYLVMDLIAGRSLWSLMELGQVPWPITWAIIDQVLGALAHAHARGVIHGDLKPQNILVETTSTGDIGPDPRVHVLDFGLAFLLRDRHDPRLDGSTKAQVAIPYGGGTPGFMAPEQIRRAVPHVGPPTDLYALGCILFQLLDGRPPFIAMRDGEHGPEWDEEKVLQLHKRAPVPTPDLPAGVPPQVAELVIKMLAKRPWRRFELAGDLRDRWEHVRPTVAAETIEIGDDDTFALPSQTSAPDTRIDVLSVAPINASAPVVPPRGAPELLGLRPPAMVGRGHERLELHRLVDLVCASDGPRARMVTLDGEAGVGKSRLAEWLCERTHETAKMLPLRARYRRINGPQDGLNGAVLAHYGLERVDRILVEQALINVWEVEKDDDEGMTWVAATAEWLRPSSFARGGDEAQASGERRTRDRPQVGPTGKRFTLDEPELRWLVIRRILERIGRDRPILLWLDDAHHAPPATFDGLVKILREVPRLRMLIVATARQEALVGDRTIDRRLDTMRRALGGPRIRLAPLEVAETHALLRAALPLDDRAIHEAQTRSKGNPLFALQLLHAWAATGGLELVGDRYRVREEVLTRRATTTADLWDERIAALDPLHGAAAEAAAALGHEFRGDTLRRLVAWVVGLGGFGVNVARALDALQKSHILVATGEDRFRFPHALLQEHLLHRLAARDDAREVFRAAAEVLSHHPLAGTRRVVRHRVLNLLRAGDGDAAAELLLDYVEEAWSRVRDATRTLEDLALLDVRRLDVVAKRPDAEPLPAGSIPPPAIGQVWSAKHLRWRAEALRHAGRFEEARDAAQRARKIFVNLGEERDEAHVQRLLGHIASEIGEPTEGRKTVARALSMFDRLDDDRGRATCEVVIGEIDYLLGDHVSARDALHRGARRFKTIGDPLGRAQCLLLLGLIELAEGQLPKARDLLLEAHQEFDGIGYRLGLSQCDVALAHVEHRAGDLEGARTRAQATRAALRSLENPRGLAAVERLLSMIAIDQEDAAAAQRHAVDALDLYTKLGDPWGVLESRLLLAQEDLLRGALDEARAELETCDQVSITEAEPQQHRHLVHAWLAASQGYFRKAAQAIADAQSVFADRRRMGDHAAQLLQRFDQLQWKEPAGPAVREWCDAIAGMRSTGAFPSVERNES